MTVVLADERGRLDRAALDSIVRRVANGFRAIGASGPVAVCARNAAEVTIAHLGAMYAGRHSVPVNALLTGTDIAAILGDCRAAVVCVGPETADAVVPAAATAGVPTVLGWRCASGDLERWEDWVTAQSDAPPNLDDPAAGNADVGDDGRRQVRRSDRTVPGRAREIRRRGARGSRVLDNGNRHGECSREQAGDHAVATKRSE